MTVASRSTVHPRPVKRVVALAALLLGAGVLAGCGGSDADEGGEVFTSSATVASTEPTTTAAETTAATTTTEPDSGATLWIGTVWTPGVDDPQQVYVDGVDVGLTSVSGLCADAECELSSDLLTTMPGTGGAPRPGAYVLFANRLVERRDDGGVVWEVTDAVDVTLAEGESPILCTPSADPAVLVQGIVAGSLPEGGTVVPDRVWVVEASGAIATPDPAGYTCEVGQD
jgi:hypothetical protein